MKNYLALLNENQYLAVTTNSQYVRVVAGAGSGKTRVLTHRIAYLIEEVHIEPYSILAITFTNKVAKEMEQRAKNLLENKEQGKYLSIMTFHKFCALFLRKEIHNLGFPSSYIIFDEEDSEKIIKEACVSLNYGKKDPIVKQAINFISHYKGEGMYPSDIDASKYFDPKLAETLIKIYAIYEEQKSRLYALDFDDLINKTILILKSFPNVRNRWMLRFTNILIDEFQDTNNVQYELVKLLLTNNTSLYVVGDPDQTIYTWRGANPDIIINLNKDFLSLKTIILDKNYRSTQTILNHANFLINNNKYRIKKDLISANAIGKDVICTNSFSSHYEAKWVCDKIKELKAENAEFSYKDVAILYRANYLSNAFEIQLTRDRIPFEIYGGTRFYQRKEIKDVLAYFRLCMMDDDFSFLRIINTPKRGLGEIFIGKLKEISNSNKISCLEVCKDFDKYNLTLSTKQYGALSALLANIEKAKERIKTGEALISILKDLIIEVGYLDYLALEEDGDDRIANFYAILDDLSNFINEDENATLDLYLQNIALLSSQDEINDADSVKLMTVHTAKGLEFKYVFIIGFNDSIFPSKRSVMENPILGLEEERRLAYVAITRAMERLFITCNSDFSYVVESNLKPSSFIKEAMFTFDAPILQNNSQQFNKSVVPLFKNKENSVQEKNGIIWNQGDICYHKTFGKGVILEVINGIVKIDFESSGIKKILASHSFLTKFDNSSGGQA